MKFQGVLITDALTSISVVGGRTVPETAVEAFSAGVDMIMVVMDGDVEWQTHAALVSYIEGQGLAEIERLNASVARILNLKTNLGLFGTDEPADAPFESNDDIESVAKSAGRAGVTFFHPMFDRGCRSRMSPFTFWNSTPTRRTGSGTNWALTCRWPAT